MPANWDDATWKPGDDDPWAATEYRETSSPVPDYLNRQAPQDFSAFSYQYQPGDEKYRVGHPTADFGYGVARGLGKLAVGASRFGPGALIDQATGFSQRIEDMLPESSGTGLNRAGEISAQMAVTAPLAMMGGAGLGAGSVLGRMGAEAARGGALGAIANPDSPGAGLGLGATLGGAGQGLAEGLKAMGPAAIQAMKRLYGTGGALEQVAETPLPGVTPDTIAERLLDTGAMTGRTLRERTGYAFDQAGRNINQAVAGVENPIPIERLLPQSAQSASARGMVERSGFMRELAAANEGAPVSSLSPQDTQVFKQVLSDEARRGGMPTANAAAYRESAGRAGEALREAVPGYDDLMFQSQLARATSTAAGNPNPLATRLAGMGMGAMGGSPGGIPGAVIGSQFGGSGGLGEAGLLSFLQAMRGASKLTQGVPFAQSAESTIPLWSYEEQQ